MAKKIPQRDILQSVTIVISSALWKQVRALAVAQDMKLWQAVEAGLRLWVEHGKATL